MARTVVPLPDEADLSFRAASALLREGAFEDASAMLEACLAREADHGRALFMLSALRQRAGATAEAVRLMRRGAAARPLIRRRSAGAGRPLIVQTRCLESGAFKVIGRPERGYRTLFKGGHFSTEHLLDDGMGEIVKVNIADADLRALDRLPDVDLLLNTVACADRGAATLAALSRFLEARPGLPVINRPAAVALTTRDGNHRRLASLPNVRFPRTVRFTVPADPLALVDRIVRAGFDYPFILRGVGFHTGRRVAFCRNREDLVAALGGYRAGRQVYVVAFHDLRDDHGVYRKARAFFVDGRLYPVALLGSDMWQIHSGDRYRLMPQTPRLQEEERRYLADPVSVMGKAAFEALKAVGTVLDLDFAGVDFAVDRDGALFVFEANPAMRHNFDHAAAFPYTRPHLEAVSAAFGGMVQRRIAATTRHPAGKAATG